MPRKDFARNKFGAFCHAVQVLLRVTVGPWRRKKKDAETEKERKKRKKTFFTLPLVCSILDLFILEARQCKHQHFSTILSIHFLIQCFDTSESAFSSEAHLSSDWH